MRQEAALSVCEGRKDAAIAVIDAVNAYAARLAAALAPPPGRAWWRLW